MSDRFFVCPEGSKNQDGHVSSWQLCSVNGEDSWIHLSHGQMAEYLNVELPEPDPQVTVQTLIDVFFTPMLSLDDHLILFASVALYFATCWGFSTLGKAINPR